MSTAVVRRIKERSKAFFEWFKPFVNVIKHPLSLNRCVLLHTSVRAFLSTFQRPNRDTQTSLEPLSQMESPPLHKAFDAESSCMYLRLFLNFTGVQHVGAETSFESEKRKRLFSGDPVKIKPLMPSSPIVPCTPEASPRKAKMHLKLEHIFVYG